jgi:DNA processing protein
MRSPVRPATSPAVASLFTHAPLPVAALDDRGRLACLRLIRSENVGPVTFRDLINHYGGAEAALDALPELSKRAGRGRPLRLCPRDSAERELEAAARCGAAPIFTIEPGYPRLLAEVEAPPPLLYVKGDPALLGRSMVAIVGSRLCSAAGMKLAAQFADELGGAGFVIASGLARGIDGVAHETALASGTVAVLAGGIDIIYPPEHKGLYARIGERGCLVTEMAPGFSPRAQDFPRRNRIISGVSLGVVIIEAAKRSGTLVTARYAGEQGREVFAIPGHPLDPRSEGTNGLLKDGAVLTCCPQDVLDVLGPITGAHPLRVAEPAHPPPVIGRAGVLEPRADDLRLVAGVLGPHPVDVDAIVRATGLPIRLIQVALMELDLAGRIERHGAQLVSLRPQDRDP